jgi:hypothetical protein
MFALKNIKEYFQMGGETKNIDKIAEIISSRIFDELRWINSKTTDFSWKCCMESHLTVKQRNAKTPPIKTHPTDIVFSYIDPYTDVAQYIQTDLKSYKKSTLEKYKPILGAIRSLSEQVECSSRSPEWKDIFVKDQTREFIVHGMLFIYNHDNEYDNQLLDKLSGVTNAEYSLPSNSFLSVFDPKLIRFLLDVTDNIEKRRAYTDKPSQENSTLWQKIPEFDKCSFYYPDKHNKFAKKGGNLPATIEMITSGLLFYTYEHQYVRNDEHIPQTNRILNIFWQENVDSHEYFIFILEYIFNYQLLNQFERIFVVTPFSLTSGNYLNKAIQTYADLYSFTRIQLETLIEKVISIPMPKQTVSIFEFQVASKQIERKCHFS